MTLYHSARWSGFALLAAQPQVHKATMQASPTITVHEALLDAPHASTHLKACYNLPCFRCSKPSCRPHHADCHEAHCWLLLQTARHHA